MKKKHSFSIWNKIERKMADSGIVVKDGYYVDSVGNRLQRVDRCLAELLRNGFTSSHLCNVKSYFGAVQAYSALHIEPVQNLDQLKQVVSICNSHGVKCELALTVPSQGRNLVIEGIVI